MSQMLIKNTKKIGKKMKFKDTNVMIVVKIQPSRRPKRLENQFSKSMFIKDKHYKT